MMGKRELVALLSLSSWCLVIVVWVFLVVSWVCMQFVIVVFLRSYSLTFSEYMHAKNKEFCNFLVYSFESNQLGKPFF